MKNSFHSIKRLAFLLLSGVLAVVIACDGRKDDGGKDDSAAKDRGFYTYTYTSTDSAGEPLELSSALIAKKNAGLGAEDRIETVIVACHITITSDIECPSKYKDNASITDVLMMSTLQESSQYRPLTHSIIIMPDYEGYGLTRDRVHPYLAMDLGARQITDAVQKGLEVYSSTEGALPLADDWKLICVGYSQGGAMAAATQRYLEETGQDRAFHLAGSVCGDAPMDMLQTLRYYIEDNGESYGVQTTHRRNMVSMAMVLPMITNGMIASTDYLSEYSPEDFFSKQFLDTGIMDWLAEKKLNTMDIRRKFYEMSVNGYTAPDGTVYSAEQSREMIVSAGKTSGWLPEYYAILDISKIFSEDYYDYMVSKLKSPDDVHGRDSFESMYRAMKENSLLSGWEPRHKMLLAHSKYDTVVPYQNAAMFCQAHPDAPLRLIEFSDADHISGGSDFFFALSGSRFTQDLDWVLE